MKKQKAILMASMLFASALTAQKFPAAAAVLPSEVAEGTYLIRNVNSGIYMDVESGKAENGTNVQQWGGSVGGAQNVWHIVPAEDGYSYIYSMVGDGNTYCLTIGGGANGKDASICIQEKNNSDAQLYKFAANSDGSFRILTKASDDKNAVEVINAETANGADVQAWESNGVNCQDWELIPISYVSGNLVETKGTKTGNSDWIAGDINEDGTVNGFDLALARQLFLSGNGTEAQQAIGDVDADGSFHTADVTQLQKFLLNDGNLSKREIEMLYTYAAADGTFTEGVSETTNAGFLSESYLNLDNKVGTDVSWNIAAPADGLYAVTFRYANGGTSGRAMQFTVGNQLVCWTAEFPSTGSWTDWKEITLILPLQAGVNHLTGTSLTEDGAPNLDQLQITHTNESESPSQPLAPIVGIPAESSGDNGGTPGVGRQMEALDRGVTAAYTGSGMLVSWRSLATDSANTTFKLYQNGTFIADIGADDATNYFVDGASAGDSFTIDTYVNGVMTEFAQAATILGTKNSGQSGAYMDIPMNKPADQIMPDGTTCTYTPNDCSVGDVDGDGAYEIIVKWDPSNSQDNSKDGYTGTVFLDCYEMNGTQLWRIDLGINIRAGAHYTQYQVYDFDGDGKSELMCKTSDGTVDGTGVTIGDASADYRTTAGRILSGNEYLTLFDGQTGAALDTIDYEPGRGDVAAWGDSYGNRVDRFLSGVAYLDGTKPSAIFCRGYYTRTAIAAYDVVDKKIVKRWLFDTGNDSTNPYYGQGNHSLVVMDVDNDGKDEIIYGSCCIDDNGTGLWSTGLGHGDCMQAGDLIPDREGLEVFQVHEEHFCAEIHDAATGEIIWSVDGSDDVGRGIALNLTADYPGMLFTSVADNGVYYYNPETKTVESTGKTWSDCAKWSMNSAVWWDGDLEREALDRTMVEKMGASRVFTGDGVTYNNSSKANACLTADLFGDWREEMIFATSDGTALRVFGTTYTTDVKLFT
ncbi:MAG: RICIN domain-containing protein, partial [Ruminococcus sp.]